MARNEGSAAVTRAENGCDHVVPTNETVVLGVENDTATVEPLCYF